jgi:hypothetical protein
MILIRKDRIINEAERKVMLRLGELLGFDRHFCEETIKQILTNEHITEQPPRFSDRYVAQCFIRDGLKLSLVDGRIHRAEFSWLEAVAKENGLNDAWLGKACTAACIQGQPEPEYVMEASCLEWQ